MNEVMLNLGFTEKVIQESNQYEGLYLGRVISQSKDLYRVATAYAEVFSEVSGNFRFSVKEPSDYPVVGDFVMIDREDGLHGNAIIHRVLNRKSVFIRRAAGTSHEVQVVASNIDTAFICMSLNLDFNVRRLERYLAIAWESGATPVVVLTKSDLCDNLEERLLEIKTCAIGVDVLVTSSETAGEYWAVIKYIKQGQTIAFMGSSGVGKSTLINRLLGVDAIETKQIGKDDKGRHATTRRELFVLPTGGAVIDTPGMREIGVESVDLKKTFAEIDAISEMCKFKDCQHENEPDCAVVRAIEEGLITAERLQSYNKLKKEAKYDGMNAKQIDKKKSDAMFSGFGGIKNAKEYLKNKRK